MYVCICIYILSLGAQAAKLEGMIPNGERRFVDAQVQAASTSVYNSLEMASCKRIFTTA